MTKTWPDGGIGRFYFCEKHGVLARRQTWMATNHRRRCRYCTAKANRAARKLNPEPNRLGARRAFERDRERHADDYARVHARRARWVEINAPFYATTPLDARRLDATAVRTPRTVEILNDVLPTWPQWVKLLGAVMAPITRTDLERWAHAPDLTSQQRRAARLALTGRKRG